MATFALRLLRQLRFEGNQALMSSFEVFEIRGYCVVRNLKDYVQVRGSEVCAEDLTSFDGRTLSKHFYDVRLRDLDCIVANVPHTIIPGR